MCICLLIFYFVISRFKTYTQNNATEAKREGIFLFTVGIGNQADESELISIASDPKSSYYYSVDNFNSFNKIQRKLSEKMSEGQFITCICM